ncbi:MAG TPA: TolC family protein, partial [Ramlibacter sp.]
AAAATAARERAVAAGQRPDPVLRLGISNLPIEGPDRFSLTREGMTMRNIGVMQELTRGDKLAARTRRFEQEALAAEAMQDGARLMVRREAGLAWVDLLYAQRTVDGLRQQQAETRLQHAGALAALRGGRGSQAEVVAAQQATAQLDDRIDEATRELQAARAMLARWIGEPARRPLLPALPASTLEPGEVEQRIATHPQLRALHGQESVAEAEVAMAAAERRADWSVELMYSQRASQFGDMVSLTLSRPLEVNRGSRQDREVAARRAEAERAREEREEAQRALVGEAQALLAAWQSARRRLQLHDARLLPLASDRVQAALAAYRGGGMLAGVLEARTAYIEVHLERLRLERDAARAQLQLDYLLGGEHAAAGKEGSRP